MTVAYLVNQYPQTSQSFIRREIAALEAAGLSVARFTLRRFEGQLVDPADEAERAKTRVVLNAGIFALIGSMFRAMVFAPVRFGSALSLTIKTGRRSQSGIVRHLAYLAEACVLRRWLQDCDASHLHAHFGTNSAAVAMLCRELGGPPYSFTVHGPEEFDAPVALSLGDKIQRASFVIAVSSFGRAQLCRWSEPAAWEKIHIVRCGVDDSFLDQPEIPISAEARFVCVGRLEAQKGQLILLEAVAALVQSGVRMHLTLLGDGSMRGDIENYIREKSLQQLVHLSGWSSQAEVRKTIIKSRALILSSFAEGLPVVAMESLALNRPVIATSVAGVPELVEAGVNGWLVPAGSSEALVDALKQAIEMDSNQLSAMGSAGRQRVLERHNASQEAERLATLFNQYRDKDSMCKWGA